MNRRLLSRRARCLLAYAVGLMGTAHAVSAEFDTVINVPPLQGRAFFEVGTSTQLNLDDGGFIRNGFVAGAADGSVTNAEVNIRGGEIGFASLSRAYAGSVVNISGGVIDGDLFAEPGSVVNVTGGQFGQQWPFWAKDGSHVRISGGAVGPFVGGGPGVEFVGGEFRLNGVDHSAEAVSLGPGDVLSGTLEDGTVVIFADAYFSSDRDRFDQVSGVTLTRVDLPPASSESIVIDATSPLTPRGLRAGQSLTLREGGTLPDNFATVEATLNVEGGVVGSGAEILDGSLNVSGGYVGSRFTAHRGSVVNVTGGQVGPGLAALPGSVVNVQGGAILGGLVAQENVTVNLSAGSIGAGFSADFAAVNVTGGTIGSRFISFASAVELVGGEFRLDGAALNEGPIALTNEDEYFFTGTLSDGSPIIFTAEAGDWISNLNLTLTPVPTADLTPMIVDGSSPEAPAGLRPGQTLAVRDGGTLGNNFAVLESKITIDGGVVGDGVEVLEGEVSVHGGVVGAGFDALKGSKVTIKGGSVGAVFEARSGSEVTISGGVIGDFFRAMEGSSVTITGGQFGYGFQARSGSTVKIAGGALGDFVGVASGSDVEFAGGEFRFDGVDYSDDPSAASGARIFTGTLADGTPFVFSRDEFDSVSRAMLTLAPLPAADLTPMVIDRSSVGAPKGLRAGQTLTLRDGGELGDNFAVVDATLTIEGGIVGSNVEVVDGVVVIDGGVIGEGFDAYRDSRISVRGGSFSGSLSAEEGSLVEILGGTLSDVYVDAGAEVHIRGGDFDGALYARDDSSIQLSVLSVFVDGEPIEDLSYGRVTPVREREVWLTGVLVDGSPFDFYLAASFLGGDADYFSNSASLTVVLAPEPGSHLLVAILVGSLIGGDRSSRTGRSPRDRTHQGN